MTKIIAFEGIDGTGKSVQMQRLSETLQRRGLKVMELSFPMYDTFFGEQVGRYLSAKDGVAANTVDGKSMALWFALDRLDAFKGWQDGEYDYLIINRYVLSNAVYQSIRDRDLNRPDWQKLVVPMFVNCGQMTDAYGSQGEQIQHTNYAQRPPFEPVEVLRGGYAENWMVFWMTAAFLNTSAQFTRLGIDYK